MTRACPLIDLISNGANGVVPLLDFAAKSYILSTSRLVPVRICGIVLSGPNLLAQFSQRIFVNGQPINAKLFYF
jgi:hypothetical protein